MTEGTTRKNDKCWTLRDRQDDLRPDLYREETKVGMGKCENKMLVDSRRRRGKEKEMS